MQSLLEFNFTEFSELLQNFTPQKFRAKQIFKWINSGAEFDEMTDTPKELKCNLSLDYCVNPVKIEKKFQSSDGSIKFLFSLLDGNLIEGVFMPNKYGNTICISTQVGCRMGCTFCASGIGGLVRNLSAGEILGQVVCVNKNIGGTVANRKITNIVLMGSGEPLDNYENVTKFFKLVNDENGLNISLRNISLSTSGIAENIIRLADDGYAVTLSISLHATTDETRQSIMPIAHKYSLRTLIEAARYYFDKTGRRVIFEYSMIKEKNMSFFDAKRLVEITYGMSSHINLIMINPVEEKKIVGCTKIEAERFCQRLVDMGLSATIRHSYGSDIGGACGQLRRGFIEK